MIYTLVIAVILNTSLNFYLITNFGAKGAGIATLITQFFMLICYTAYSIRIFKINVQLKYLFQLASFAGICYAIVYFIQKVQFSGNTIYDLLAHISIYFLLMPLLCYATGLININTLKLKVGKEELL